MLLVALVDYRLFLRTGRLFFVRCVKELGSVEVFLTTD